MKPTLTLDTLSVLGNDVATTPTLTPTTLKQITQLFESDDCLRNLQQFDESGFLPPSTFPVTVTTGNKNPESKNLFSLNGGSATVVTPKSEPLPTISVNKIDSDTSETDSSSDEEFQPKPKMLKRYSGKKSNKENATQRKSSGRRGNKKDDYDGLPPVERQRLVMKRQRNKEAAARCRQRKVDLTNSLQSEVKNLMGKKEELEEEIRSLRCQKEELEFALKAHLAVCTLNQKGVPVQLKSDQFGEFSYILNETEIFPERLQRPTSLSIAVTAVSTSQSSSGADSLLDDFLTPSTGLTPVAAAVPTVIESLNTPIVHSTPSLNTPNEFINLISL